METLVIIENRSTHFAFAIYGLAEYFKITGDHAALILPSTCTRPSNITARSGIWWIF
ncbi:MAG: hypothetical protein IPG82_09515 [Saprospiraceae bacterium]|nr:hypothetical protein [Saprospiraceae bacterium]